MTKKYYPTNSGVANGRLFISGINNRNISKNISIRSHQRGMTLIVGVILLAVLMVTSTIGFRNTTLSERMTGNAFDRQTSFQATENAGKEALQVIEDAITNKPTLNPIAIAIKTSLAAAVANSISNTVLNTIGTLITKISGHEHGNENTLPAVIPDQVPGNYDTPLINGGNTDFWTHGAGPTVTSPSTGCRTTTPFSWTSCAAQVTAKYANNDAKAQYVIELLSAVVTLNPDKKTVAKKVLTFRVTSRSTGGSGDAEVVLQSIYVRTI